MEVLKILTAIFVALNVCATVTSNNFTYDSIKLDGPCPYIKYITDYNMNSVLGWWYRVFKEFKSRNHLCYENQGHTMYAVPYNNVTSHIEICCQNRNDPSVAICGSDVGSGIAVAGSKTGTLSYYFEDKMYEIYVLYTDYTSTGIAYACKRDPLNRRDEMVFILSRGYKLDQAKESEVRDILQRNGIQWSQLKPIKQGGSIPYTAGPAPRQN